MRTYQRIVVGVDFSEQSEVALKRAVDFALLQQAHLSVIHVIDDNLFHYWNVLPLSPVEIENVLIEETKKKVEEKLKAHDLNGITYEAHVIFGKPFQSLVKYSEDEHADLLIVGQRSVSLIERILLGSTAERLIRESTIPLLTIHPNAPENFCKILVGTDFSELSIEAVNTAARFAKMEGAELHLLYVCDDTLDVLGPDEKQRERAEAQFAAFLKNEALNFQGVAFHQHIAYGVPRNELALYANELACDLVVLGTAGRSGILGLLLGNTAESVAHQLPCSLLTVKSA